ncbi:MAG: hypothetical protein R3A10_10965 [Caldilineaceae bacterium]
MVTLLYNSRLIGRHVDDAGGVAQLDQLAAQFDEDAVLLFFDPAPVGLGAIFGTPLQYLHGLTAFDVQEEAVYPDRLAAQAGVAKRRGVRSTWSCATIARRRWTYQWTAARSAKAHLRGTPRAWNNPTTTCRPRPSRSTMP